MLTDEERTKQVYADDWKPSIRYGDVIQLAGYLAAAVEIAAIDGDPLIEPEDWIGHVENGLVDIIGVDEVATAVHQRGGVTDAHRERTY